MGCMSTLHRIAPILILAFATRLLAQDPTLVRIDSGLVRGESIDVAGTEVHAFRGVPFAAPPIGELRWRPPQPVAPWDGERVCTTFAPACPQPKDMVYGIPFRAQSEDCLHLNVWTAATDPAAKRPVMVWIHGGGNVIGGAGSPVYDGKRLAAHGVVLVSIQYRLGVFGFFAHEALTAEAQEKDSIAASGNQGLLDQIAALQWVQRNIAAFGGDPGCVTIFGESAGAANVTTLMASPLAPGLFHRAIAESGYFGENTPSLTSAAGARGPSGHALGAEAGKRLGVDGHDAEALAKLRALTVEELLELPLSIGSISNAERGERALRLGPIVDGRVLTRSPELVWSQGEMAKVPFIAGSLLDDGSVFSRGFPVKRLVGYRLTLRTLFGADADRMFELFPAASDDEVQGAAHDLITALAFTAPARRLCRWLDAAGGKTWLYQFTRDPGISRPGRSGVFHGLEIAYVFGTFSGISREIDAALSEDMMRRWVTFARCGDPNGDDEQNAPSPRWPAHSSASDQYLEFGDTATVGEGLDRAACDLLDAVAARR